MTNQGLLSLHDLLHADVRQSASILLVGPVEEARPVFDILPWAVRRVPNTLEFLLHSRQSLPRVVVCEQNLPDGSWRDVLEITSLWQQRAPLIVTSRLADERLWAEVLNLGGYDVLMKPFDRREIERTVGLAWDSNPNGEQRPLVRAAGSTLSSALSNS